MTKVFVIVNYFLMRYLVGAMNEAPAAYLEWERADYREAVEGIRQGYQDVKAGRTQPTEEAFEELCPEPWPTALRPP